MRSKLDVVATAATKDLTTLARVKQELSITGSASDDHLGALIREASDAINTYCDRQEGFGEEELEETFWPEGYAECLILSRDLKPAVTAVEEDGVALDAGDWYLRGALLYRRRDGKPACWSAETIIVSYAAGFGLLAGDPNYLPHDIERAAVVMVTAAFRDAGRNPWVRSETAEGIGGVSYLDPKPGAGGLPPQVAAPLDRWVRRGV